MAAGARPALAGHDRPEHLPHREYGRYAPAPAGRQPRLLAKGWELRVHQPLWRRQHQRRHKRGQQPPRAAAIRRPELDPARDPRARFRARPASLRPSRHRHDLGGRPPRDPLVDRRRHVEHLRRHARLDERRRRLRREPRREQPERRQWRRLVHLVPASARAELDRRQPDQQRPAAQAVERGDRGDRRPVRLVPGHKQRQLAVPRRRLRAADRPAAVLPVRQPAAERSDGPERERRERQPPAPQQRPQHQRHRPRPSGRPLLQRPARARHRLRACWLADGLRRGRPASAHLGRCDPLRADRVRRLVPADRHGLRRTEGNRRHPLPGRGRGLRGRVGLRAHVQPRPNPQQLRQLRQARLPARPEREHDHLQLRRQRSPQLDPRHAGADYDRDVQRLGADHEADRFHAPHLPVRLRRQQPPHELHRPGRQGHAVRLQRGQ